jgi:hypothetical protein
MCRHVEYVYAGCQDPLDRYAHSPHLGKEGARSYCYEPCKWAYKTTLFKAKGDLDHSMLNNCPKKSVDTVLIRTACVEFRSGPHNCPSHAQISLRNTEPRFANYIEQGKSGLTSSQMPRLEDMVWHVPAVWMIMPVLSKFTWDPSKSPGREEFTLEPTIEIEDEYAYEDEYDEDEEIYLEEEPMSSGNFSWSVLSSEKSSSDDEYEFDNYDEPISPETVPPRRLKIKVSSPARTEVEADASPRTHKKVSHPRDEEPEADVAASPSKRRKVSHDAADVSPRM